MFSLETFDFFLFPILNHNESFIIVFFIEYICRNLNEIKTNFKKIDMKSRQKKLYKKVYFCFDIRKVIRMLMNFVLISN